MSQRPHQDEAHRQAVETYYATQDETLLGPVLADLRPRIAAYLTSRGVRNAEQVEDLVQETLAETLIALRARRYTAKGAVAAWVMAISWVVLAHSLRRKKGKPSEPGRHEDPFLLVGPAGTTAAEELPVHAEEEAQAGATLAAVSEAVFSLDPNAQAAVVLHFYQGLPASEAADRMGVTESLFKERLNRGLASLREWAAQQDAPTAEVYAALRRVDSGDLFRESGRQTK